MIITKTPYRISFLEVGAITLIGLKSFKEKYYLLQSTNIFTFLADFYQIFLIINLE